MTQADTSGEQGNLNASVPDASDAFAAPHSPVVWQMADDPIETTLPGESSQSSAAGQSTPARRTAARMPRRPLLDSKFPTDPDGSGDVVGPVDPADRMAELLAPREMLHQLWSPLAALRGHDIHLVTFSLTSPDVENIHAHAADFARLAQNGSQEGALVVRDVGPKNAREHYYSLVLTRDADALRWQWSELTGASQRLVKAQEVTGWTPKDALSQSDDPLYASNVAAVVFYAFHPLPGGAVRCLNADVHASGPFAHPWEAAQRAIAAKLRGQGALRPEDAAEASSKRRECPFCTRPFPFRKRSHAIWCSPRCRKAAHAAGVTALHGQLVPKAGSLPPMRGDEREPRGGYCQRAGVEMRGNEE